MYRLLPKQTGPFVLLVVISFSFVPSSCAKAPPNLSPAGKAAWTNTRVIKILDLLRDTAVSAAAQNPPLIKFADRQRIVLWHEAAIKTIHATSSGWTATVMAPLDDIVRSLGPSEQQLLMPYVTLLKSIVVEVK